MVTADRDHKVRVSAMPQEGPGLAGPFGGAHTVQSFCLGHTAFATAAAPVLGLGGATAGVLSAAGDGTVRLWDHLTGAELASLTLGTAGAADGEPATVVALAVGSSGLAAAVLDGTVGVSLLRVDSPGRSLSASGMTDLPGGGVPASGKCPDALSASASASASASRSKRSGHWL